MFDAITGLFSTIVGGITTHFENKQKLQQAIVENKLRLAASEQTHNEDWEMKQLENAGWKDDVLFYAWISLFIWSAIDPDSAHQVFVNWSYLPDWFVQLSAVLIGAVLGIRKLSDYCPAFVKGVKTAWNSVSTVTSTIDSAKEVIDEAKTEVKKVGSLKDFVGD